MLKNNEQSHGAAIQLKSTVYVNAWHFDFPGLLSLSFSSSPGVFSGKGSEDSAMMLHVETLPVIFICKNELFFLHKSTMIENC